MSVNSGTSSVAGSNWMFNATYRDANGPELSLSAYNVPHRIKLVHTITQIMVQENSGRQLLD